MASIASLTEQARASMEVLVPITSTGKRLADQGNKYSMDLHKQKSRDIKSLGHDVPVTILNLNPFPLKINGGMLFPEEVAACPVGQPYTIHVLREIRWTHKDNGCDMQNMMQMEPMPYVPKMRAVEYIREYIQAEDAFGGVICYLGDGDPAKFYKNKVVQIPTLAYDAGEMFVDIVEKNFHEIMASVKGRRNRSVIRGLQAANSWYENDHQRNFVNDNHREMARLAFHEGLIEQLPRWVMQDTTLGAKQPDPCVSCATVPKAGAIRCSNCNYVFDVVAAYKAALIAHGSVEFDRLTVEDWKQVNQIKAERDRNRANGSPQGSN